MNLLNFIKLIIASIVSFIGASIALIITLPWLWNWIVTIYKSPLPATEASKIYLYESLAECFPFVFGLIVLIVIADILINKRWKEDVDEYQFYHSPYSTPVREDKKPLNDTHKPEIVVETQSRGVDTIVSIPTKNGGEFVHVKEGTKEHKQALDRKALAEKQLKEQSEQVNQAVQDRLKQFDKKVKQNRIEFQLEQENESYC